MRFRSRRGESCRDAEQLQGGIMNGLRSAWLTLFSGLTSCHFCKDPYAGRRIRGNHPGALRHLGVQVFSSRSTGSML